MDEEILSILGIDSVEDLTHEEYLSLLKEASVRAQMKGSAISKDALIRITKEIKRVRSESTTATAKGTSQEEVRKRKVNPQKVFASKPKPVQRPAGQKLLTASKEKEAEDEKETRALTRVIPSALNTLAAGVNNIVQVMVKDLTMEQKQAEAERKAAENLGREEREEDSEKKVADKSRNFFKGFKPPKLGIFDKLKNFFTMVALGGLFTWLAKEENRDKIEKFTDFIEDHGSKILLGIAGLLALGIGAQILSFVASLITIGGTLLGIFTNPVLLAALGIIAAGTWLTKLTNDRAQTAVDLENQRRELTGEEPLTQEEETKQLMSPEGLAQSLPGMPIVKPEQMTDYKGMKLPPQTVTEDKEGRIITVPLMKDKEEMKNVLMRAMASTKIGDGTRIRIPGVGTIVQGRNIIGVPTQKYYTADGKQVTLQELNNLLEAKRVESGIESVNEKPDPDSKSELTERELIKKYWNEGIDKMTDEEKKTLWESLGPKIMSKMGDLKPDYEKFLKDNKREDSYESWLAYEEKENLRFSERENRYYKHKVTPTPTPKPAAPDAPVLPEGADAANKQLLENIRQGGADPKTKAILEDLIKNGSTQTPVKVSVTPAVIPPGPGQGASAHAGQNSAPKFPTTDQSNMSVAAVAGVYNSPIPRA